MRKDLFSIVAEGSELAPSKGGLTPDLTPSKSELTPGKSELTPGKSDLTPSKSEVISRYRFGLTPGKSDLTPSKSMGSIGFTPSKPQLTPNLLRVSCFCKRCSWTWKPFLEIPRICPKCKSKLWDVAKV
jgi:hypothetical protein